MRTGVALVTVVAALGLGACAADQREWMKVDARYTKEEFQRDYRDCSRGGDLNDACMRQRGWLPVSPSKSEATPAPPAIPRSTPRY
jgi:hypothetical protein